MNIPKNFQSQLKLRLNEEYSQYKANFENKKADSVTTSQLKSNLIDKVVLTTVDSSSFDKYIQTIENGKKSVADKFVGALETFADKIIDGINNTTKADKKADEKSDENTDGNKTTDTDAKKEGTDKTSNRGTSTSTLDAIKIRNLKTQKTLLENQKAMLEKTLERYPEGKKMHDIVKRNLANVEEKLAKVNEELEAKGIDTTSTETNKSDTKNNLTANINSETLKKSATNSFLLS